MAGCDPGGKGCHVIFEFTRPRGCVWDCQQNCLWKCGPVNMCTKGVPTFLWNSEILFGQDGQGGATQISFWHEPIRTHSRPRFRHYARTDVRGRQHRSDRQCCRHIRDGKNDSVTIFGHRINQLVASPVVMHRYTVVLRGQRRAVLARRARRARRL